MGVRANWELYYDRIEREEREANAEDPWGRFQTVWEQDREEAARQAAQERQGGRRSQREWGYSSSSSSNSSSSKYSADFDPTSSWGAYSYTHTTYRYTDYGRSNWGARGTGQAHTDESEDGNFKRAPEYAHRDLYSILEVSTTAPPSEIKKAYRKLARKWHPDAVEESGKDTARIFFQEISNAYDVLSDPMKRSQYNRSYGFSSW
mmetsp:Transcript_4960/g.8506  ORF Transcript_4960/g.8506 Transcript_4960/m.8506 type:complete len:205 (+) Transcript_4960:1-615(+)